MAEHTFANKLYAHLNAAITAAQVTITIVPEEMPAILQGFETSKWLYLTIMKSNGSLELVKVTELSANTLTVERGQGGTTARAFPVGSPVSQRLIAEYFTQYLQKGIRQTASYNPNGVTTGYHGEKFYQDGPTSPQIRWWINTGGGTQWRLLSGDLVAGLEYWDSEGYIIESPVVPDIIYPDQDVNNSGFWGKHGEASLFECLNDTIAAFDDDTYIYNDYYSTTCIIGLETPTYSPGDTWIFATIRVRAAGGGELRFSLYYGATLIGSEIRIASGGDLEWEAPTGDFHTYTWAWGYSFGVEVTDLRIKIENVGSMGSLTPKISEIEVELS